MAVQSSKMSHPSPNDTSSKSDAVAIGKVVSTSIVRSLPQPKPKRSRRSAPKSRNGCRTCKIRHEKCDERKPECTRKCDFLELIPLQNLNPSKALIAGASFEVQNLDYFRNVCTVNFSGFFNDHLWQHLVLQQIMSQDCVRHAAAAVGAVHRSIAFPELEHSAVSSPRDAFANYTKAIELLAASLDSDQASYELACVASVLFMSFEVLRGNESGAMIHIQAGFRILETAINTLTHEKRSIDLGNIMSSFSRLDIQASSFSAEHVTHALVPSAVPSSFSTMVEARDSLSSIIALMHSYIDPSAVQECHRSLPLIPLPEHIADQVLMIDNLLTTWSFTFESFATVNAIKHTPRDHAAATILRISHLTASIYNETYYNMYQTSYDAYRLRFKHVLELATVVLEFSEKNKSHGGLTVAFDIGIIQPLHFLVLKCRDRTIRRRAIGLIERAGREGVWDGGSTAAVLKWIVEKEEEDLPAWEEDADGEIVEEKRLQRVVMEFHRSERRAVMRGGRRSDNGEWEWVEGETRCWGADVLEGEEGFNVVDVVYG